MSNYQGNELALFENATNWKKYFASFIKPYLKGHILEIGAGIGGTTKILCDGNQTEWFCLEPDASQAGQITDLIRKKILPSYCHVETKTTQQLTMQNHFDVLLYIDVLEHIENDELEIQQALRLLKSNGILIVLSPAHQFLYSEFDKSIGHYRRYNKKSLREIMPTTLKEITLKYLDGFGVFASLANKIFLKQTYPTQSQIEFWDHYIINLSKQFDFLTHKFTGRSLLGIWQKKI